MKLKRIFACALASVFTAAIIIPHPASAADSAKNIGGSQEMICNEANEELKESNNKSVTADEQNEKSQSNPSTEEYATEADEVSEDGEEYATEADEVSEDGEKSDDKSVKTDEQNEKSQSDLSAEETSATDESTSDDDESLEPNKRIKRLKTKNAILKEKNKRLKIRSNNLKLIKECCREAVIGALTFLVSEVLIKSSFGSHIVDGIFGQDFSDVNSNVHKLSAVTTLITLLCI